MGARDASQLRLWGAVPDSGRRVESIEWGVRYPKGHFLDPSGRVSLCADERHARAIASSPLPFSRDLIVVSRTVVTYTTSWSR